MAGANRSKLVRITVRNIGCIGNDGVEIALDDVVCLVGKNNAGKSTILRAYELAKGGTAAFSESRDRCLYALAEHPSEVQLEVHIPEGIGNVDAKWKTEKDGLLIVKSRWQWAVPNFEKVRTTWDPTGGPDGEGGWAEDGKAGGADPVFSSRLPRPLRIGSLDDAAKTEEMLLTLALGPLVASLEKERINPQSDLSKAIASPDDPAFPGYLLLIDEPENALHPMAARAAQRHLYKLAQSPDWQVIMTTHSPHFVNPFEDHTTIVRLERSGEEDASPLAPKTYRSDLIEFEGEDKQRLQALQHIDPSFSEVFFGSYPILVEGDTEHAAFMSSIIERQHGLMDRVTVIRARGKAILVPLVKVMTHFKIDFGIVHDADSPFNKKGHKNGMWTENGKIREAVLKARAKGLSARHRISVPDFERFLGGEEESKDKPLNTYLVVAKDDALAQRVQELMTDLLESPQHEPFADGALEEGDYLAWLGGLVQAWAKSNGLADDIRFKGP